MNGLTKKHNMIKYIMATAVLWFAQYSAFSLKAQQQKTETLAMLIPSEKHNHVVVSTDQSSQEILQDNANIVPDLKFKDEKGNIVSLHSLKGKVVFINLWATWCPPCIREMPSIDELRKTFKDNEDLVFLMVDVDGNIEKAANFMKNKKFDLPVHIRASEIPRELFNGSIPTTIIIDKQNKIAGRHVGGADYASPKIIEIIKELLSE